MNSTASTSDDTFETDDIYLGAYLLLCHCEKVGQRRVGPKKIIFQFRNPAGAIRTLREEYYTSRFHDFSGKVMAMKKLLGD
jgi:hypothetical protein